MNDEPSSTAAAPSPPPLSHYYHSFSRVPWTPLLPLFARVVRSQSRSNELGLVVISLRGWHLGLLLLFILAGKHGDEGRRVDVALVVDHHLIVGIIDLIGGELLSPRH